MPEKFEKNFGEKFEKPIIPTGKGWELEKAIHDYSERFSIFEKVKNKVIFVNPNVNIPLKLEEGKESPLALFFKADVPGEYVEKDGEKKLETWPRHLRSVVLGRVIFNDEKGHYCRDTIPKGTGSTSTKPEQKTGKRRELTDGHYEYYGLLESKNAFDEYKISEELLSKDIRTLRVLAIINLEEIIVEGKKISVEKAREEGIIPQEFQPVIEVRAFGTNARISDVVSQELPEEIKRLILEDAKTLVSQEIGKDLSNDEDYLEWFAETLGRNVGLLHKNGYLHQGLSAHNITLDCRIVDLDTVMTHIFPDYNVHDRNKFYGDIIYAGDSLSLLIDQLLLSERTTKKDQDSVHSKFVKIFNKGYNDGFFPEERKKFFEKE